MKVPGAAWLQFETLPHEGGTLLVQTAYFAPRGAARARCTGTGCCLSTAGYSRV